MTQQEFAEECGVDRTTIQRGEAGQGWEEGIFGRVAASVARLTKQTVNPEDLKKPQ